MHNAGMKKIALLFILIVFSSFTFAAPLERAKQDQNPLPVDQAFQFSALARDYQTVVLQWRIAPHYFIYKDRFNFKALKPNNTELGQPLLPPADTQLNTTMGNYEVYKDRVSFPIPIIKISSDTLILQVTYQGCSNKGFCYPPITKVVPINLTSNFGVPIQGVDMDVPHDETSTVETSDGMKVSQLLKNANLFTLLLGFFGFGLLLSFTPCVLPMIPILSSIILGHGKISHTRSFLVSLSYIVGMALTYAAVGIIFGLIGQSMQVIMQKPAVIISFCFLIVAIAFSLFGFYEIKLPSSITQFASHASERQKRGTFLGAIIMGCLSTLILSPCVTPPLVAALGYISQSGNAFMGGIALFTMGIGMGVPLLLIGIAGPKLLPHTGPWMNVVKSITGFILLGLVIYMLDRILPNTIIILLWALLALSFSIFLGAFKSSATHLDFIKKCFGIVIFIYSILLGSTTFIDFNPLPFQSRSTALFTTIKSVDELDASLKNAKASRKPVILDFYANWCLSCKELDHLTFSNPMVKTELNKFVRLRIDVTQNNINDKVLLRRFNVIAPPTLLFFNSSGQLIPEARITGVVSSADFLQHLAKFKLSQLR